jgi:hypothetical protein
VATIVSGCGGGGGGGSGGGNSPTFFLADVKYGRLVDDGTGPRLVSPLTTARIDPVTGRMEPGTLQPLAAGVNVTALQTLGIGSSYLPRVVPRNGVFVLEFTDPIDPASVSGDELDAAGNLVKEGSVQIRTQDGRPVPLEVSLRGSRSIWIDPRAGGGIGFPPSPVDFGPDGEPRADATGFLKLRLPRLADFPGFKPGDPPPPVLRNTAGRFLGARVDQLGSTSSPIGINPGNVVLDFIAQNELIPTNETFNGFLPDTRPPRIVRTHRYEKALDFSNGDSATLTTITDAAAGFSTAAKQGQGEWAGARLILRPGGAAEETHTVLGNARTTATILDSFADPPHHGDVYRLERSELFEPALTDPIEPDLFDPDNPENSSNTLLSSFVEVYEIDPQGNVVAGPTTLRDAVPAFSELRIRFSEPMAAESLRPWESFKVVLAPDTQDILSEVTLDSTQQVAAIRPARLDQQNGTFEIVGWGKGVKAMQVVLTTVPKPSFLQQSMTSDDVRAFLDQGVRSITDLGGQPLAFPFSRFDPASPPIRYASAFTSTEASITQQPPPVLRSWGVIVHRMQGRPITGIDPATGDPGVGFRDQPNYYRPIGDVNLQTNGYLAASPVVFVTKIHDDFFPPPHGQFGKFPLGVPEPLATPSTASGPQPHNGARFQTVWRDVDASPNRDALAGTLLDLYRVSWAPIGGNVTTDTYDNVSIHCAHSPLRPLTAQNGFQATDQVSGLGQPYDWDAWRSMVDPAMPDQCSVSCFWNSAPNYWDTLVPCVPPGTPYKISQSRLFAPPFDNNAYHPWPDFTVPFQYNNGDIPQEEKDLRQSVSGLKCSGSPAWKEKRNFDPNPDLDNLGGDSLLFEVRIRPQTTTVSRQNGFTMAIGVLLDRWPNFRVWSSGTASTPVQPDDIAGDPNARCAINVGTTANPQFGDNSRYFTALDYVKTTSRITSPWVRVVPSNTVDPDYFPAIYYPPLSAQPIGTQVKFEFQGASGTAGAGKTSFSTSVDVADKKVAVAFKATLVGNRTSLLLPNFDTVAIPYLRPFGG